MKKSLKIESIAVGIGALMAIILTAAFTTSLPNPIYGGLIITAIIIAASWFTHSRLRNSVTMD